MGRRHALLGRARGRLLYYEGRVDHSTSCAPVVRCGRRSDRAGQYERPYLRGRVLFYRRRVPTDARRRRADAADRVSGQSEIGRIALGQNLQPGPLRRLVVPMERQAAAVVRAACHRESPASERRAFPESDYRFLHYSPKLGLDDAPLVRRRSRRMALGRPLSSVGRLERVARPGRIRTCGRSRASAVEHRPQLP